MNPLTLTFRSATLEEGFVHDHLEATLPYRLFTCGAALVLWVLTGLLDSAVAPEALDQLWTIRFAMVTPLMVTLAALTWWPATRRASELWLALTGVLTGGAVCGMIAVMPPPTGDHYYALVIVVLLLAVGMGQLRFLYTVALGVTLLAFYEFIASDHVTAVARLNARVILAEATIGSFGIAYVMEQLRRREYLTRKDIERQATHDPLTGLLNRRQLRERLEQAVALRIRYGHPTSMVLIDLDDFKSVNDTLGHRAGDKVLKGCAEAVKATIRTTDLAFRYGGDEFLVLLPGTPANEALAFADRLSDAVRGATAATAEGLVVGCTAGVGTVPQHAELLDGMMERIDRALYEGKRTGKGRAVLALPSETLH